MNPLNAQRQPFMVIPAEALNAGESVEVLSREIGTQTGLVSFQMRGGYAAVCCLTSRLLPEWAPDAHTSLEWQEWGATRRLIARRLMLMGGSTMLEMPSSRYWVDFVLPPEEADDPASRMKVAPANGGAPILRIFSVRGKRPAYLEKLRELLLHWAAAAPSDTIQGEVFEARLENVRPYAIEGDGERFSEIGIEATFDRFPDVTWPWLDLFLWFRLNLKRADRVSFRFEL